MRYTTFTWQTSHLSSLFTRTNTDQWSVELRDLLCVSSNACTAAGQHKYRQSQSRGTTCYRCSIVSRNHCRMRDLSLKRSYIFGYGFPATLATMQCWFDVFHICGSTFNCTSTRVWHMQRQPRYKRSGILRSKHAVCRIDTDDA